MFENFLQIVGALSLLVVAFVAISVMTTVIASYVRDWRETSAIGKAEQAERSLRAGLVADARWFSEDAVTFHLLMAFAKGEKDVADIRHDWRRARAAEAGEPIDEAEPKMPIDQQIALNAGRCLSFGCLEDAGPDGYCPGHKS